MHARLSTQPGLPLPGPSAQEHSARLTGLIRREIARYGGSIPFDRYMELALYAPGLGYYVAGARKFGEGGDFVTAPELSPLFSRCLARPCRQLLESLGGGDILEFGAGSGVMAAEMLAELRDLGSLPERYLILEVSPDLRLRQRATLEARVPGLLKSVHWLDDLPPGFQGVVLANEVLDAMPVHRFQRDRQRISQLQVRWLDGRFQEVGVVCDVDLQRALEALHAHVEAFPEGYRSEVNLRLAPWIRSLSERLRAGAVYLVDYGYSGAEYYHPSRDRGTLLCHYRHRAHSDPYLYPGLQDITASVDFTALAAAARADGLAVRGYTTQANFLLDCGLDRLLAQAASGDPSDYLRLTQGVKRLMLPSAMGERFKVLGLARGLARELPGFGVRNLLDRL